METTINEVNNFIEQLRGTQFDFNICPSETFTTVLENLAGFQLEFQVHYESSLTYYRDATRDNPEEYEHVFSISSHDEICLYDDSGMVELTALQLHTIDCIISESLYQ